MLQLDDDVLSLIFALSDVYTILSLSRVNRTFHRVGSSKQLWIEVARDLIARGLLHPLPIEDLNRELVKRTIAGPRTWHPRSIAPVTLLHQSTLYSQASASSNSAVELWDVQSGQRVWKWEQAGHVVWNGAFEMNAAGSARACLYCAHGGSFYILVLDVIFDPPDGISIELFRWDMERSQTLAHQLCGDFIVCALARAPKYVLLVDWRNQRFIHFNGLATEETAFPDPVNTVKRVFALIPGFLFLARPGNSISLYTISSLAAFWQPLYLWDPSMPQPRDVAPLTTLLVPGNDNRSGKHHVSVSVSPCLVHGSVDETYDILVEVLDYTAPSTPTAGRSLLTRVHGGLKLIGLAPRHPRTPFPTTDQTLYQTVSRYHFTPTSDSHPTLVSTFKHTTPWASASRAGYALSWLWDPNPSTWAKPRPDPTRVGVRRMERAWMDTKTPRVLNIPDIKRMTKESPPSGNLTEMHMGANGAILTVFRSHLVVSHYL
ncbi:hypothetical protein FB45DRAFT_1126304 [Roridomyces roridus]|uniref:F-box domain-containing protein n=1 Tax=Roridomyces roridus TaxID=1738132 RepID=A0AAD7FWV1_9AGAR|nr:hypothetical protein FB45DRAFT_1126304 [Roridomyces roridus]